MPSLRMPWMSERATRLWAMSPTIATCNPSKWPFFSRIVKRSSSAWVGCSCAPSPAFTIEHGSSCASRSAAPADDHVRAHRGDVLGGVDEALALARARAARREVDHVRGEPLAGDLERRARPGGRFVEEVDDRLAAEGGDLLDVARGDLLQRRGGVDQQGNLARVELAHREQILPRPGHATPPRVLR